MQAYKFSTPIPANHHLEITLPESFPDGEAEVIVLAKSDTSTNTGMSLREYSAWIKRHAPSGRSREAIDAQIAEERGTWGDD
jgi:hypothetical protein